MKLYGTVIGANLIALALAGAGCSARSNPSGGGADQTPLAAAGLAASVPGGPSSARPDIPSVLPGLECLTTPEGLRRKVVTTQAGLRCLEAVDGDRLVGGELPLFQELFVLDVRPSAAGLTHFLVSRSPRKTHQLGYLGADSVAEWNTRLGYRPLAPVLFYPERKQAEELAQTGQTGGQPVGRAAPDSDRRYLPWPVVGSHTVTNQRGQVVEVAQLNFLGERRVGDDAGEAVAGTVHYSETTKRTVARAVSVIGLAFCVDNTQSTDPFVPQIIQFIVDTSQGVAEQRPELKLNLTLYRDQIPGLMWGSSVTKTFWDGVPQPIAPFLAAVRPIAAPTVSSVDYPECSYQGLLETLTATKWEELSHKVVVWISDNSGHPPGSPQNPHVAPADIIRVAKAKGIVIQAVAIRGFGGDEEQRLHHSQCREVAEAAGGNVYGLADAGRLAARIGQVVQKEHAVVRKNRDELQQIASGQLTVQQYLASNDQQELRRRYQFVRLLQSAGLDLEGFAPDQPTFAQGWAPSQLPGGPPLFERMVYVSRVELDVLLSELNDLVTLLRHDGTQGVLDVFATGLGARVGDQSFLSQGRQGDIPFDVFMAARGIPLRTGITMKSRDELLGMSAEEKLLLKARLVNEVIPNLTNARSSSAFTLTGDFDFGWIPENMLP
jgi:hypothetical protein